MSTIKATERAKCVLILGCGWIGFPLAKDLIEMGYEVYGTTTSSEKMYLFKESGIKPICVQVGDSEIEILNELKQIAPDTLIISYPLGSRRMKGDEYKIHTRWIQKNLNFSSLEQVILTSSTSVYPDGFGQVDETCATRPDGAGLIQLNYEDELRTIFGDKLVILRLAGLIGPGRHPGRFLAGKINVPNPNAPVNLVHLDDVILVIKQLVLRCIVDEVLNVCADEHPSRFKFYTNQTMARGLTPPVFKEAQTTAAKFIDNTKLKNMLGVESISLREFS